MTRTIPRILQRATVLITPLALISGFNYWASWASAAPRDPVAAVVAWLVIVCVPLVVVSVLAGRRGWVDLGSPDVPKGRAVAALLGFFLGPAVLSLAAAVRGHRAAFISLTAAGTVLFAAGALAATRCRASAGSS